MVFSEHFYALILFQTQSFIITNVAFCALLDMTVSRRQGFFLLSLVSYKCSLQMFENRCILLSLAEPVVELDLKFLVLAWLQNMAGSVLRKGTRREIRITQRKPGTKLWLLRGQSRLNPGFQNSYVLGIVLLGNVYCIPVFFIFCKHVPH